MALYAGCHGSNVDKSGFLFRFSWAPGGFVLFFAWLLPPTLSLPTGHTPPVTLV